MPLQFSVGVRNAMLDAVEASIGTAAVIRIRTGAQPANCAAADAGTVLANLTLASDWATAAANGVKAFGNVPLNTNAVAAGTAGHYRIYASNGTTCHSQGSVTFTGGGGDMEINAVGAALSNGQDFSITAWSWTAPNP